MPTLRLPFDDPPPGGALPDAADRAAAVDPTRNVVLEASAGTGKTRVLVDRYVNLLKAGVDPSNVLAITFTRKAAAEMRARILATLRAGAARGEIDAARWRDLRERLGDVAISTIDAFCLALLREFPLEADLDPSFGLADETETLRLVDEALDRALRICRAVALKDESVALVFAQLGDRRLRDGLAHLLDRRLVAGPALSRFLASAPADLTPDAICRAGARRLHATLAGVPGGLEAFLRAGPLRHPRYQVIARDLHALAAEEPVAGGALRLAMEAVREYFFTASGQPRRRWHYKAEHAASAAALRRHQEAAAGLADRLREDLDAFRRDLNVVLARGVWRVFAVALDEYRDTLDRHAVLDFPDLLWRTLGLLDQMDEFARSRFLLEARYHHLLVDEFQDTSDAQWQLVWRLVQAWGEGVGQAQDAPLPPSIFIVGDRKQSIYGFRDADVGVMLRAAGQIAQLRGGGAVRRAIRRSFRSVAPLLAFANDLFTEIEKIETRADAFAYGDRDRFPLDQEGAPGGPVLGLAVAPTLDAGAAAVAAEVHAILAGATVRDRDTGVARPARPGDIAVLFRTRDGHQAFESALEARGVPSYVYKGLGFFDADEIKDVFALLRYLADPQSDLRAAELLRSRLVRLSDAGLAALAPHLALALAQPVEAEAALHAEDRAVIDRARAGSSSWRALADRLPPAELLDRVLDESAYLFETAGPRAAQARENLKKIRSLVRRIQNRGYATLARVAAHLDRLSAGDESNAAIDAADSVNLMTVHAAKGLGFPIVFLVNLGRGAGGSRAPIRVVADDEEPAVAIGDFASEADADAAEREREETKRLLYVAVTRARDRLYLSAISSGSAFAPARGSLGDVLPPGLRQVMGDAAISQSATLEWRAASGRRHVFRRCGVPPPAAIVISSPAVVKVEDAPPLRVPAAAPARVPVTALAREGTAFDEDARGTGGRGALVGSLVHRLFERAAAGDESDPAALASLAESLLREDERALAVDPRGAAAQAADLYAGMSRLPVVAALLAAGRRWHEVPVAQRRGGVVVHGTIDLLVERADGSLVVVELKTGARAPGHERQLSLYVDAIRAFRPGASVSGLLVYPGAVFELPAGTVSL